MARIVVLTPNPAVDITYEVASSVPGETNRVERVHRRPGGKGVNVSRALADTGHHPVSVLPLGGQAGEWIAAQSATSGYPTITVPIAGVTRSTVAVLGRDGGHPTVYTEPGPVVSDAEWASVAARVADCLVGADAFVISGSLPPETPMAVVAEWVGLAASRGILTVADMSGAALIEASRAGAIVKPNAQEARDATGATSVESAAAFLLGSGSRTVVISEGSNGLTAYGPAGTLHVPAVPGVRGNPTGAGDAATAGLASALADHLDLAQALRRAAALGAAAVLAPVAGEVDLEAYERFTESFDHGK